MPVLQGKTCVQSLYGGSAGACREEFLDLDGGALADEVEETDATAPYNADTSAPVFKSPYTYIYLSWVKVLPTLNRISSWIESVFAFVSGEAINHGVPVEGYKVVEGRSKRIFTDTKAVHQGRRVGGLHGHLQAGASDPYGV